MWSVKCEMRSEKCGLWSVKCGLWSAKCEVWTVKCAVWSVKCEVWGLECEGSSEKWEVWSVKCGVWSLKFGVRRVQCAVWGVECRGKDTVGTGCLWTIGHLCLGNFRRRLARVYVIPAPWIRHGYVCIYIYICEAPGPDSVHLVNITSITMIFGTQITIVTGAFVNQLMTGGPHIVYVHMYIKKYTHGIWSWKLKRDLTTKHGVSIKQMVIFHWTTGDKKTINTHGGFHFQTSALFYIKHVNIADAELRSLKRLTTRSHVLASLGGPSWVFLLCHSWVASGRDFFHGFNFSRVHDGNCYPLVNIQKTMGNHHV